MSAAAVARLSLALVLAGAPGALASNGTPAQRRACKPDVLRLCRAFIPNRARITGCLSDNRASLSPHCRAVIAGR